MKITEISVSVSRSRNYQSFKSSMTATLENDEMPDEKTRKLFKTCNDLCEEQIR